MSDSDDLVFRSERDGWLVILIWSTVALMALGIVAVLAAGITAAASLVPLIALSGGIALVLAVLYGTDYRLGTTILHVRSGPFRWTIPLEGIQSVVPSNDPTASPACSLDRLAIGYAGNAEPLLISPENRAVFLETLVQRCPALQAGAQHS